MEKLFLAIALIAASAFLQSNRSLAYNNGVTYSKTATGIGISKNNGDSTSFDSQMLIVSNYAVDSNKMHLSLQVFEKKYGHAALYVAALYNNTWYFWDITKSPAHRWVAIYNVNTAARLPEVAAGNQTKYFSMVITEIDPSAHGAAIYVGVGFGSDPASRKKEMLASKRFRYIRTIP